MDKISRICTKLAVVTLTLMCLVAPSANAQIPNMDVAMSAVLSQLPANSAVVIVVRPLGPLSVKVNGFAQQIGMPQENPINLSDKLAGMLSGELGGAQLQIDPSKPLAIAIQNLMDPGNSMIAFVPVKNAAGTVDSIPNKQDVQNGIWQVPAMGYVGTAGNYLMLSEKVETIQNLASGPKGVKLSASDAKLFAGSDVAATINLTSVMPIARGLVMAAAMGNPELQQHPSLVQMLTTATDRFCELQKISLGGQLGQTGINIATNFKAQDGSKLASYLSDHPKTKLSSLASLPATDAMYAFAFKMNPKLWSAPLNSILDAVANDPSLAEKVNPDDVNQLKGLFNKMAGLVNSGAGALYSTDAPQDGSATGMNVASVVNYANMAEAMKLTGPLCESLTKLISQAGYNLPIEYKKGVGSIDGLSYDQISVDMSHLPIPPEAMKAMAAAYGGKPAFTEQFCMVNDELMAIGMGASGLQQAIKIAKAGPAGLDKNPEVVGLAKHLPAEANAYVVIDFGKYLQSIFSQMPAAEGGPDPMMMAAMLGQVKGTIGAAVTIEDGLAGVQMHVPTSLVQSGVGVVMPMMMQMGQGPGGQPSDQNGQQDPTF